MRESISMAAAATARAMAVAAVRAREVVVARAREVARGGGDVRERAPHGENENGLDINK